MENKRTDQNPWEEKARQADQIKQRMSKIKHKIAIISGKGGVGKSLVTVNLATGLARNGRKGKIAILDADLTGPCINAGTQWKKTGPRTRRHPALFRP